MEIPLCPFLCSVGGPHMDLQGICGSWWQSGGCSGPQGSHSLPFHCLLQSRLPSNRRPFSPNFLLIPWPVRSFCYLFHPHRWSISGGSWLWDSESSMWECFWWVFLGSYVGEWKRQVGSGENLGCDSLVTEDSSELSQGSPMSQIGACIWAFVLWYGIHWMRAVPGWDMTLVRTFLKEELNSAPIAADNVGS